MATFYLDFENGDDSKDGTTFANRWKTITSGATAARTAPGDTIRMMKSPDPVSLGVNGTFTNKSATITLASAKTANISLCTAAWTPSANVTSSTSITRKEGSVSTSITVGAAFTTGMLAYEATGTLDLSAYTKISFWIFATTANIAANTLRLDLCSDTAGATPVHSFTITNALSSSGVWSPQTFDNGSALSSSIKSVALTALTDPGVPVIRLDNIFACNDLHLQSLIGASSSATDRTWYPVRSVNGTTVTIDTAQQSGLNNDTSVGFSEATTTTTAYTRAPIRLTSTQTFNEAGTATARIIYSGGWDRTNMTSQDGMTVLFGDENNVTTSLLNVAALNYINVERVGTLHGNQGLTSTGVTKISDSFFVSGTTYSISALTLQNVNAGANSVAPIQFAFGPCAYDNIYVYSSNQTGINKSSTLASLFGTISNSTFINTTLGIGTTATNSPNQNFTLNNVTIKDCTSALVRGTFKINGFTATGNSTSVFNNCNVDCNNITYTGTLISVGGTYNFSRFSTYAGAIYSGTTLVVYDVNTPLHGSASRSWRHDVQASSDILNLIDQPLQGFAVGASTLVTFKIWTQRTSTSVTGRVRLKGYTVAGVDADVTATSSAAINTWEELSITFTPSAAGVAVIDLESYTTDGNTGSVFFGDATVTQA